jgi:gamma-butyrobetaine dioxygenase
MPDVALGFPAAWLRHNCPCEHCRDPVTGQRLIEITDIPDGCGVTVETQTAASVTVVFTPDGHRGVFSGDWLAAHALPAGPDPRTEDGKQLWRAADLATGLPGAAWDEYLSADAVRERCLDAVARLGVALLRDVPPAPGTVLEVARTFGFVRETNYGRLFDVRVIADPANLAYTSREIPPHTDNPYRDPVPTLQLLHCLRAADIGGDSGLVDGFAAAAALRAHDPAAFATLTAIPWPFAYADKETELNARAPLITLTPERRVAAVRLNNRSMGPLRLPAPQAAAAYAAYRTWAALLARPEFRLTLRLTPGDCLIFDNTRVLHARTAFTAAPDTDAERAGTAPAERHLQGCYADLDGLLSTLAVLRRSR